MSRNTLVKIGISAIAVVIVVAWLIRPDLDIPVLVGLLVIALLPWIFPSVKTAKLPGGVEIEFRDIEAAGQAVITAEELSVTKAFNEVYLPSYISVAEHDPNLALVGLRIEIEKRLRNLAVKNAIDGSQPTHQLLAGLSSMHVLPEHTITGLKQILDAGNQAAHGASVENEITEWAFKTGPQILAALDTELLKGLVVDYDEWLQKALIILDFEGGEFIQHCITYLSLAKREGRALYYPGFSTLKTRAGATLLRLGALDPVLSVGDHEHCQITAYGEGLLSQLLTR